MLDSGSENKYHQPPRYTRLRLRPSIFVGHQLFWQLVLLTEPEADPIKKFPQHNKNAAYAVESSFIQTFLATLFFSAEKPSNSAGLTCRFSSRDPLRAAYPLPAARPRVYTTYNQRTLHL
jgi:hypothetical protein